MPMDYETSIIPREFYAAPSEVVAKKILGQYLVRRRKGKHIVGKIVEVEAYLAADDPAAHNFIGETQRNKSVFLDAGHAYVHSSRHHFLIDIVTDSIGVPWSVLIRALEPVEGLDMMMAFRKTEVIQNISNGPGKLCQALQISRDFDGKDITNPSSDLFISYGENYNAKDIVTTTRIGISKAADLPLRFYVKDSVYISRK